MARIDYADPADLPEGERYEWHQHVRVALDVNLEVAFGGWDLEGL